MALQKCPECGNTVTEHASFCPACGYGSKLKNSSSSKDKSGRATSAARIILMVFAILSFIPALMICGLIGLIIPGVLFILALCLK